jgi:hypothetical protein
MCICQSLLILHSDEALIVYPAPNIKSIWQNGTISGSQNYFLLRLLVLILNTFTQSIYTLYTKNQHKGLF